MLFYVPSLFLALIFIFSLYFYDSVYIFTEKVYFVTFSSYICSENGQITGRCTVFYPVLEGKYTDKIEKVKRKFIF